MLKQTRRNRFLHIDGWQYQGLRSRLARHGPIGGIALRPSSFEVEMSLVISLSRKLMCKSLWWSVVGGRVGQEVDLLFAFGTKRYRSFHSYDGARESVQVRPPWACLLHHPIQNWNAQGDVF